jgi:hypothetical protein
LNKEVTWLIHDFGKSEILTELTIDNKRSDAIFFIDIINQISKSPHIQHLLEQLKSDIQTLDDPENFMDVIIDRFRENVRILQTLQTAKATRRSKQKRKRKRSKKR